MKKGSQILPSDIPSVPIPNDILENVEDAFNQQTLKYTLENIRRIGKEANKYLIQLKAFENWFKNFQKYLKENSISSQKRTAMLKDLSLQKGLAKWEIILKNAYVLIQKTREFFTKENLQYILHFDETLSKNNRQDSRLGVFSLGQILPTISLKLDWKNNKISLFFGNRDSLISLYDSLEENLTMSEELEQKILKKFGNILQARQKNYQNIKNNSTLSEEERKKMLSQAYTNRGFATEAAISIVDSSLSFIKSYKIDNEAFWRGGDLQRSIDRIPQELLNKYEQANFEVKRVSATSKNSVGANLASLNGLITALEAISGILNNSSLTKKQIEFFIESFLFKSNHNIKRIFAEEIKSLTANELNKYLTNVSSWRAN